MLKVKHGSLTLLLLILVDVDLLPLPSAGLLQLALVESPLVALLLGRRDENAIPFGELPSGDPVGEGCEDTVLVRIHDHFLNIRPALAHSS